MTAPFWLVIFVWYGGDGIAVEKIGMPDRASCEQAVAELPTYLGTTIRAACLPGVTWAADQ